MSIHPTAIIDPTAEVGASVEIGPYAYIGPHCKVGEGSKIAPHAVLEAYVTLGGNCRVSPGAVLGGAPQDVKFQGEESYVIIGDNAVIRECVTINRASGEKEATTVGNGCMLMAYTHLGHNCKLGNEVIIANNAQLAGYVEVGDYAFISGTTVFHQFIKIGRMAMIGGFSGSRQDIPPFSLCFGQPLTVMGINKIGLRRRGVDADARNRIKQAFQALFFSGLNTSQALETVGSELAGDPYVDELLAFVRQSRRGIRRPERREGERGPEMADSSELAEVF